jgi:methylthioribose-1-phosphate isomerase
VRTIDWSGDHVVIVEQTKLPHVVQFVELRTVDSLIGAVRRLAVRGAPALGVAGGLGVALAAVEATARALSGAAWDQAVRADAARLRTARPTAVNLAWGVDHVLERLPAGHDAVVAAAVALLQLDIETNRALSMRGAALVRELTDRPARLLTHCNAGGLACVEWGTALGVVRALHEQGWIAEVFADETRPLLQGARLTAFELAAMGIPHRVVVDGAGPSVIARGMVDAVVVGADRIAANGDVVNKIGTYPLALAAKRAGVAFLVAAPESTIDPATADGAAVEIEHRSSDEVTEWLGTSMVPPGTSALNLAFDVTPYDLVTALITERRAVRLAADGRLSDEAAPTST